MLGWGSSLPEDLVVLIAKRVRNAADFVRCGAVCRLWGSAFVQENCLLPFNFHERHVPWLMLAEDKDSDTRGFFNVLTEEVHELYLPEARGRRCPGSNQGWLVTMGLDMQIHLLNPLSRVQVSLPSMDNFPHREWDDPEWCRNVFVQKVVLSSSPTDADCIAMAIYEGISKLAFARPGDKAWTSVACPIWAFENILYFKGNFYAITRRGEIAICDIGSNPRATFFSRLPEPPSGRYWDFYSKYLVESSGDMLAVIKDVEHFYEGDNVTYKTRGFMVFKLLLLEEGHHWVALNHLDDFALFLGFNSAISVSTKQNRCKENCIYFDDDQLELYSELAGDDQGIFNLESGEIEPHYKDVSRSSYSPPCWIAPCPLEL